MSCLRATREMSSHFRLSRPIGKAIGLGARGIHQALNVSDEVRQALAQNTPVVALESTIITHGFPYPQNVEMAQAVEQTIRDAGCVPATCAFLEGQPHVGLTQPQIEHLGPMAGANKVSRRDIGVTMAQRLTGGTTISGTMILAHMAGIKVFATGGLGGVHRDGHITMDVSADLTELARTPVAVVCAGPKLILDIARTVEYLETQGVYVGTYNDDGRADVEVPGFFARGLGVASPYTFSSWRDAAAVVHHNALMGLTSSTLFCVPPPLDVAIPADFIEAIIAKAVADAAGAGISGKRLTPFLLQTIARETQGRSIQCNRDFVVNNAKAACSLAHELHQMEHTPASNFRPALSLVRPAPAKTDTLLRPAPDNTDTLVIGLLALDTVSRFAAEPVLGDSNPATMASSAGGVGHNVALAHRYGLASQQVPGSVRLVSAVGDDLAGAALVKRLTDSGADSSGILTVPHAESAQYSACVGPQGDLVVAAADMRIMDHPALAAHVKQQIVRANPRFVIADCNLLAPTLDAVLESVAAMPLPAKVIVEPTSQPKLARLSQVNRARLGVFPNNTVQMLTPTAAELARVHALFAQRELFDDYDAWFPALDSLGVDSAFRERLAARALKHPALQHILHEGILQQCFQLLPYIPQILVKLGRLGCVLVKLSTNTADYRSMPTSSPYRPELTFVSQGREHDHGTFGVVVEYFPIPAENENIAVTDVTGAGDTLLGYLSSSLIGCDWLVSTVETVEQEWGKWEAVHKAQLASGKTIQSHSAVCPSIAEL